MVNCTFNLPYNRIFEDAKAYNVKQEFFTNPIVASSGYDDQPPELAKQYLIKSLSLHFYTVQSTPHDLKDYKLQFLKQDYFADMHKLHW